MIALTMGACATIKPAIEVQVRPVLKSTRSVDQQNFNIETALAEAQRLQGLSDYAASYDAYNVLLMHMRTTLNIEESLLKQAARLTGVKEKTALVRRGLEALIALESARRLAVLGSSEKKLKPAPRRRTSAA